MQEGELVKDVEPIDPGTAAREIWGPLATAEATLSTQSTGSIMADEEALKRLLENLFKNALEHAGPPVAVVFGELRQGFYVEDDGPGVPEDERERVFDAGYSTKDDGAGFGMASVRQLAIAHGWEITATAGTDGGARFEITDVDRP